MKPMKLPLQRIVLLAPFALTSLAALAQERPADPPQVAQLLSAQAPGGPSPDGARASGAEPDNADLLSVADLVALVQRYNPQLRASLLARDAAAAGVRGAAALPNPSLEAGTGHARARSPGAPVGSLSTWSVAQTLENPSLRSARIDAARFGLSSSQQQIAAATNDLVAQVRLRVYELLLQQEEAAAAEDALALLEQIRDRVRTRVNTGEAPRYEIIKADAEVVNARLRAESARLGVDQAKLAINRLAAGQMPARWRLAASLGDAPALPPLEQLQRQAKERNPDLAVLQADLARLEARLREVRASRFPGVDVRYGEQRELDTRNTMLSLGVRLPLLDQRKGAIDEAAAEVARTRTLLEGRRTDLALRVSSAAAALELARLRIDALSRGAQPDAEAALRVAQAAYRFGERGILDVLDAQRLLRSVRADLIDARFRLQAAAVELEFLAGRFSLPESMLNGNP